MSFSVAGADVRLFTTACSTPDPVESPAEGYLVSRYADCGFVGDLRTFPTACLGCGGPREALSYEIED